MFVIFVHVSYSFWPLNQKQTSIRNYASLITNQGKWLSCAYYIVILFFIICSACGHWGRRSGGRCYRGGGIWRSRWDQLQKPPHIMSYNRHMHQHAYSWAQKGVKTFEKNGDVLIFLISPKYLILFNVVLPLRGYRRYLHVSQKTK